MFSSTIEARVVGGLVIKQAALRTLAICSGLSAVGCGVHEVVATFALFDWFGLSRNTDGDGFAEEEVSGFKDLFHFVSRVVMEYNRHGVGFTGRVFQGAARPQRAFNY